MSVEYVLPAAIGRDTALQREAIVKDIKSAAALRAGKYARRQQQHAATQQGLRVTCTKTSEREKRSLSQRMKLAASARVLIFF